MDVFENIGDKDIRIASSAKFSDDYKNLVFTIWYNEGKPIPSVLREKIPAPDSNFGEKPTDNALRSWIKSDTWQKRAAELDAGVRSEIDAALVMTKVETLSRHARTAQRIQEIGLEWLETHKEQITPPVAARLIIDGVRMEADAVGIGGALQKLMKLSDDELKEELIKVIEESDIIEEEFLDE